MGREEIVVHFTPPPVPAGTNVLDGNRLHTLLNAKVPSIRMIPLRCEAVDQLPRMKDGSGGIDARRLPPPRGSSTVNSGVGGQHRQLISAGVGIGGGGGGGQRRLLLGNGNWPTTRPATSFEMRNGRLRKLSNDGSGGSGGGGGGGAEERNGRQRNFPHLPDSSLDSSVAPRRS